MITISKMNCGLVFASLAGPGPSKPADPVCGDFRPRARASGSSKHRHHNTNNVATHATLTSSPTISEPLQTVTFYRPIVESDFFISLKLCTTIYKNSSANPNISVSDLCARYYLIKLESDEKLVVSGSAGCA